MAVDKAEGGKPLVSIVTACYNEELYIADLLESVLGQTYSSIEMICVDDGSTDNTAEIVKVYTGKFEDKGYRLKYLYQDNAGQAAATNRGLKLIRGKYLCWIDADDWLVSSSIEKRVIYLETHRDISVVTSDFYLSYQNGRRLEEKAVRYGNLNYQSNQFYLTLTGESIIENLAQMLRVDDFRKINPAMEISDCREGQNYQILLPMLYYYKRGYINEKLGYYRIHEDSHCHRTRTYTEQMRRFDALLDMEREVLSTLGIPDSELDLYIKESTFYMEKRRYLENAGIGEVVRK